MLQVSFSIADVSFFIHQNTEGITLATEAAEAIQCHTLRHLIEGAEVYVAGGRIQAVYDWKGDDKWTLSESYAKQYVYDVRVREIEREINSGLFYLPEPEETAFKLTCGLIIEHDVDDAYPYVLHGRTGGEIDRWDAVRDLAEGVVDQRMEEQKKQQ